jgi:RNA polymerase sigma-54 factor
MSPFNTRLFQSQQLKQEMRINPRLYQAMELLYMPLLDLQQHLKQEMAENPFLEMSEADVQEEVELKEDDPKEKKEEEIDWEEILLDGFDAGGRKQEYEHREYIAPTAVESRDLHDHLEDQLRLLDLDERAMRLGEEIIGNLDDAGMLGCALDEVVEGANAWLVDVREVALERAHCIQDEHERAAEVAEVEALFRPYEVEEAEVVLARIQGFDPPGVGARDLRESIMIQMRQAGEHDTTSYRIVVDHFDDLVNHRWSDIARSLGISARAVQDATDDLRNFDPKPGMALSAGPDHYVIPDLIVEKIAGEYLVFVNDTNLPRLRLSRAYREVARDRGKFTGENKEFISPTG